MENGMNVFEIEKILSKLNMYKNESEKNTQDILIYLEKLNAFYKSDNTKDLVDINLILRNNFIKLNNLYNEKIVTLRNYMNKIIDTNNYTRNLFEQSKM